MEKAVSKLFGSSCGEGCFSKPPDASETNGMLPKHVLIASAANAFASEASANASETIAELPRETLGVVCFAGELILSSSMSGKSCFEAF